MTDTWVNYYLARQGPIGNLFQAVKMGREMTQRGLTFGYLFSSFIGNGTKTYSAASLQLLYNVSRQNAETAQSIVTAGVLPDGTPLTPIDEEVLILMGQYNAIANMSRATIYAQNYRAQGKSYAYVAAGFADLNTGDPLPPITYGLQNLINLGNRYASV